MKFTISEIDFIVRILNLTKADTVSIKQHYNLEILLDFIEKKKNEYIIEEEQKKENLEIENKLLSDSQKMEKEYKKKYNKENREKINKYAKEYYRINKKAILKKERERRLLKKADKCWEEVRK